VKILIIGGTVFLGRTIVEAALEQGHSVTLFNRGQTHPQLFSQAEKLIGDRSVDLSALRDRKWEVVIDTCGYLPPDVRRSAEMLSDAVEHYTFISTVQAYADLSKPDLGEQSDTATLSDQATEELSAETYGPFKAICERAVMHAFPGRALVVRPGLIVGPHDASDRFTYWVVRVSQGGEVMVAAPPDRPVQFIDVRDLAGWILRMAAERRHGIFNAVGSAKPVTMGNFLEACRESISGDATFTWVDDAFLLQHEVQPWSEMPMWFPKDETEFAGLFSVRGDKALQAGLNPRPMHETIGDTLAWAVARPQEYEMKAGITRHREAELLKAWHEMSHNA
jgi:2'-hydroxyisoflavone reductase